MISLEKREIVEYIKDRETISNFIEEAKVSDENIFSFLGYPVKQTKTVKCVVRYPSCNKCNREIESLILAHRESNKNVHAKFYSGDETSFTKDHIIPSCRGGTNHLFNLQTLCYECNMEKGNSIPEEITPVVMITAKSMKDYLSYSTQNELKEDLVSEIRKRSKNEHPCPSLFRREKFLNMFNIEDSSLNKAKKRGVVDYSLAPRSAIEDWI